MRCAALVLTGLLTAALPASANEIIGKKDYKDVVTVRVSRAEASKQQLPIFPGISGNTAGSQHLTLLRVVIPPGASAQAHVHKGYESAIYLLQGEVETRYGDKLEKSVVNKAGDFIFIPPDVPHQPVNLSKTEAAIAIVARNDPNEQEHVVIYKDGEKN